MKKEDKMIYGYLRKSKEERSESSFDTQRHKINGYCSIHSLTVDDWFQDICSGGLLLNQREQGLVLVNKLKKYDTIICSDLDRYSRSHCGLINDVEKYRRMGVKLIFTNLGDVISTDSLGSVFYQILSIMSEWYRKSLSEKQLLAKDKLRKQKKWLGGRVTKGFDIGEDNKLVECEKEQREIRQVLMLRKQGMKYKDIVSEMEKSTGKKWWVSFVHKLVQRHIEDNAINQIAKMEEQCLNY
jgi:DNA invertase Pin-like site-specific DNA recombinase|tara:strand:- start:634 stop:1356 length:723 start_codon:yes stop_codon:yes gene_type:complete